MLGIALADADIINVPLLAADPYGHFIPPQRFPQLALRARRHANGTLVAGNPATPIATAGTTKTGHEFLDDIAHNAVPRPRSRMHGPS